MLTDRLLTVNEVIVSIQLLLEIVGVLVANLGHIEVNCIEPESPR